MTPILDDVIQAGRAFRGRTAFALFGVATVAIGIGGATLVFSLVQSVLLRALPFEEPAALVWMFNARTERDRAPFSAPDLEDSRTCCSCDRSSARLSSPFGPLSAPHAGRSRAS